MKNLLSILSETQKTSFLSGNCSSGAKIPIDGRFPAKGMNLVSSRYDAGCPIARIGVDNEGFVYLPAPSPISNESIMKTLCYAKMEEDEKTFFVIGIGNGAKNAKQPLIDHINKGRIHPCFDYKIKSRFLRKDNIIEQRAGETAVVFFNDDDVSRDECEWYCDGIRANLFPRDFTWEFPEFLEKVDESFQLLAKESCDYMIAQDSRNNIHLFQQVDNDFCVKLFFDTYKLNENVTLFVGNKIPTKRSSNTFGYIIFGQLNTVDGPQYRGYETEENPCWDLDTIATAIVKKIVLDIHNRMIPIENMLNYFSVNGGLALTPQDSKNVGNCAIGTWNWIIEQYKISTTSVFDKISWDQFPIPLDQKFQIDLEKPIDQLINSGFYRVVNQKYVEATKLNIREIPIEEKIRNLMDDHLVSETEATK